MTRKRKQSSHGKKDRPSKHLKITPVESNQSENNQEENSARNDGIVHEQILCKGPCNKLWDQNQILQHLRNINCRVFYSEDDIEAVKAASKQIADYKRDLKKEDKRKQTKNDETLRKSQNEKDAKEASNQSENNQEEISVANAGIIHEQIPCKGPCNKLWDQNKILQHLRNKDCRVFYNEEEIEAIKAVSKQMGDNKKALKRQEKSKQTKNDENLRKVQNVKDASRQQKKRKADKTNEKTRLINFRRECQYGPIFTCLCCLRDLFKKTVKRVTPAYFDRLSKTINVLEYLQIDSVSGNLREDLKVFGNHYVCKNCSRYLERGDMPPICAKNGLEYAEIPSCLQLVNLERQLICKDLVFIKVREMHKSGMSKMNDHVINVPIGDDDIIKTVNALPRTQINNGLVTVGLKRDMAIKNFHRLQLVRPDKVYEALLYLKDNHPSYTNIDISSLDEWHRNFLIGEQEQTKCPEENLDDACNNENPDDSSQIAEGPQEKSIYNFATCLIPEDPLSDVVGKIYF